MILAGAFLPPAALAIERSSNVYWLRRDRAELWFEARGYDPSPDGAWTRVATTAAWIASAGDAIAVIGADAVTGFTAVAARPLFSAAGLGGALAVARAAVVEPVRRLVYVATSGSIIAIDDAGTTVVAEVATRALALSSDRRRLYAATATAVVCVATDTGLVTEVAALPPGATVTALTCAPAGVAGTALLPAGTALLGINLRHGTCRVLCPLPAELGGAPVVADHTGMLTLAGPDRLYRCGFDGSELAVCFTPPST